MAFIVQKNPLRPHDVVKIDADSYKENGSFTEFYKGEVLVQSIQTQYVTDIKVESK